MLSPIGVQLPLSVDRVAPRLGVPSTTGAATLTGGSGWMTGVGALPAATMPSASAAVTSTRTTSPSSAATGV